MAISPRGYRGGESGGLRRITVGFPGTPESVDVVKRVAALTDELDVALRVATFAVRGRTMYPPEVGLHAEDSILAEWATHARAALTQLQTDGVVAEQVELAVDAVHWVDGEILALGTSSRTGIASVFLGSRGAKILRHSPVPVLVLPA